VLYEHGGLWMDTDVVLLRPFTFHGDHFLNLQWRSGGQAHFICGNGTYWTMQFPRSDTASGSGPSRAEPEVRIHLPPPASLKRTRFPGSWSTPTRRSSPGATPITGFGRLLRKH
jgi:hypothetical protein